MSPLHNPNTKTSGGVVIDFDESVVSGVRLLCSSSLRVLKHYIYRRSLVSTVSISAIRGIVQIENNTK